MVIGSHLWSFGLHHKLKLIKILSTKKYFLVRAGIHVLSSICLAVHVRPNLNIFYCPSSEFFHEVDHPSMRSTIVCPLRPAFPFSHHHLHRCSQVKNRNILKWDASSWWLFRPQKAGPSLNSNVSILGIFYSFLYPKTSISIKVRNFRIFSRKVKYLK